MTDSLEGVAVESERRRRWTPTVGQAVCLFALLVGITMLVIASVQSGKDHREALAGTWVLQSDPKKLLRLDRDGSGTFDSARGRIPILWSARLNHITIRHRAGAYTTPTTDDAYTDGETFEATYGITFRKVKPRP
jgi:hypothetical protein